MFRSISTIGIKDTRARFTSQPKDAILGEIFHDTRGNLWMLCQAAEALIAGEVVQQQFGWLTGTAEETAAIGTYTLHDDAVFANVETADIKGALGITNGTLANAGQQLFRVVEKVSDDEILIQCLESTTAAGVFSKPSDGGWGNDITTSTTFRIWKPGRVIDAARGQEPLGVANAIVATASPYFMAQVGGLASAIVDDSDSDVVEGEFVCVSASTNGYVEGPTAFSGTPTVQELEARAIDEQCIVGKSLGPEPLLDGLLPVQLMINPFQHLSWAYGRGIHPRQSVDIG